MATKTDTAKLDIHPREARHSRATRRLRREGRVPGVLYGMGAEPVPFDADERDLRHALAAATAVLELSLGDGDTAPAVVKDVQRHPVRGELMHVDLLRVDLKKAIHASVSVEIVGQEDAPGVREGGVLEHVTREVNVEALPSDIPETIQVDVSALAIGDSLSLEAVTAPDNVTLLDDPETTIATLTAPRLSTEGDEEIEAETEVVGEGAGAAEGEQADAGDVPADAGGSGGE